MRRDTPTDVRPDRPDRPDRPARPATSPVRLLGLGTDLVDLAVPPVGDRGSAGPPDGAGPGSAGLDDQLCFALYAATNAVVRAYRPLLQAVGLTYPQYVVLMALWESDDVSVTELSLRVRMPLSGLAPILDRLVDADLVERRRLQRDRRVVRVALTDRGRQLEEHAVVAQQEVRCQTRLSTDDVEQLRDSLQKLTSTLDLGRSTDDAS